MTLKLQNVKLGKSRERQIINLHQSDL